MINSTLPVATLSTMLDNQALEKTTLSCKLPRELWDGVLKFNRPTDIAVLRKLPAAIIDMPKA